MRDETPLIGRPDAELAKVDPLEMNLMVARGVPELGGLDLARYGRLADEWAGAIGRRLPADEGHFRRAPQDWRGDLNFFRLGVVCGHVDQVLGIRYREDHKEAWDVRYTDPCDLFLNGVMDSRRGTCANMSALHLALAWRLGWPASLACARSHILLRYDDGRSTFNIEATNTGAGGFASPPDDYYVRRYGIHPEAVRGGSDLTALRPRQLLGLFVSLRARHWQDTGRREQARRDYLTAMRLFPQSWYLPKKCDEVRPYHYA